MPAERCPRCSAVSDAWTIGLLEIPRRILVLDHDRKVAFTVCHSCAAWIPFREAPFAEIREQVKLTSRWNAARTIFPAASIRWAASGEMLVVRAHAADLIERADESIGGEVTFGDEEVRAEQRAHTILTTVMIAALAGLALLSPRGPFEVVRILLAMLAGTIAGQVLLRLAARRPASDSSRTLVTAVFAVGVLLLPALMLLDIGFGRVGGLAIAGIMIGILNSTIPSHRVAIPALGPLPRISGLALHTAVLRLDGDDVRLEYRRLDGIKTLLGSDALRVSAAMLMYRARRLSGETMAHGHELAHALGGWRGVVQSLAAGRHDIVALGELDGLSTAALLAVVTDELVRSQSAQLLVDRPNGLVWNDAWDEVS